MKQLNIISFASRAMCIGIVILTILVTACKSGGKYVAYHYDNGDDYFCEGLQRIVDQNGKIGFRDSMGNIAISPQFAFAFPFKDGYAKVTESGHMEAVDKAGEYNRWVSDSWYYIDKVGKKHLELIEICGTVRFSDNAKLLKDAIITNNRTEKSVLSDSLGRFRVLCENGDSLNISYVGLISQTIPVNPADSTEWNISMREYEPIIEPMLMSSVSSYDGVTMSVENLNELKIPVDSIVVSINNNTDRELLFGEMYTLEKRSEDNWIPMPYNRKYVDGEFIQVFSAVGYLYAPHSTNSNVNYTQPYSLKFEKGIYRLTKDFSVDTATGWSNDSISVVFEIKINYYGRITEKLYRDEIIMELKDMSLEELWELFPIILSPHNPEWQVWAADEIQLLTDLLADFTPTINHIGSTAVPDIMAKPIVDILVEISSDFDWGEVKNILEKSGYICMSESVKRMSFNKGYTPAGYADKVFHIHIHAIGDNDEICFRDFLRRSPSVAKEYETLKLGLLPEFRNNRDGYTEAKSDFINKVITSAKRNYTE